MRLPVRKFFAISVMLAFCLATGSLAQTAKKPAAKGKTGTTHHRKGKARKGAWKKHGQQAIQPERAREIQEALIREHYLAGEPTGAWDARTQDAMTRYQNDNGWQTKVTPDSRALIKLGLGPNYSDNLIKPAVRPASDAVVANGPANPASSKQR